MRQPAPSVLRTALTLALVLSTGAGCETVEPMDHPFQQVPVASAPSMGTLSSSAQSSSAQSSSAQPAPADDRFADFDGTFTMSSDEMGVDDDADADGSGDDQTPPPADDLVPADEPTPAQPAAPTMAAPVPLAAQVPMIAPVPAAPLGWAIRLVSTIPQAQPPRAILGLPNGEEIVVTPGSMVPEAGLVVLSVGPQGVQLARVEAAGDHATVDAFNLSPQY